MFDMVKIGKNIAKFRKAINITQMELADHLGISFQAVSNWERGQSMPDISKLKDLSDLFHVTIDELLDNHRAAELMEKINANENITPVSIDELQELAQILKPKQLDKMASSMGDIDINEIASVAPFLSDEFLEAYAKDYIEKTGDPGSISTIAPFLSEHSIDELVSQLSDKNLDAAGIKCILPFASESALSEYAKKRYEKTHDLSSLVSIAALLKQEFLDSLVEKSYMATNNLSSLAGIAPFVSGAMLNKLAIQILEMNGLKAITPILPFIDSKVIEDYIVNHIAKKTND